MSPWFQLKISELNSCPSLLKEFMVSVVLVMVVFSVLVSGPLVPLSMISSRERSDRYARYPDHVEMEKLAIESSNRYSNDSISLGAYLNYTSQLLNIVFSHPPPDMERIISDFFARLLPRLCLLFFPGLAFVAWIGYSVSDIEILGNLRESPSLAFKKATDETMLLKFPAVAFRNEYLKLIGVSSGLLILGLVIGLCSHILFALGWMSLGSVLLVFILSAIIGCGYLVFCCCKLVPVYSVVSYSIHLAETDRTSPLVEFDCPANFVGTVKKFHKQVIPDYICKVWSKSQVLRE